jgi:chemotaxis protein CheC
MTLTHNQQDALTELINIAYARAAGALSQLTGYRIKLAVPKIAMHPLEEVGAILSEVIKGEITSVSQVFTGHISGSALLLLDADASSLLNRLLRDADNPTGPLDMAGQEVITELGNIVLNACLGVFGNLLQVRVTFAVPRLHVQSVETILRSTTVDDRDLSHALLIHTRFELRDSNVSGYLVIILGVTSLDRLLTALKHWEDRQTKPE